MMLHAHYLEPFSRVNGLEKMLRTDDYHMVVSMDEVLKEVLSPSDNLTKLDMDKQLWNQLEIGSTLRQAEAALDAHADSQQPIFFYDQPKNVHQFARNDVPSPTSQHWQAPAGMNGRITYEVHWVDTCLGEFFAYLKQHGMYDNSIIIVTSDHGDATGEFGRIEPFDFDLAGNHAGAADHPSAGGDARTSCVRRHAAFDFDRHYADALLPAWASADPAESGLRAAFVCGDEAGTG